MPALPRIKRIRVEGSSMRPALSDGDWLLVIYQPGGVKARYLKRWIGRVVLVRREIAPELLTIKRLVRILDTGYWVEGDNQAHSTDSRQYLTLQADEIVGLSLLRYRRAREL